MKYFEKTDIEKRYLKPSEAAKVLGVSYHRFWALRSVIAPNSVKWAKRGVTLEQVRKIKEFMGTTSSCP
jgi:hypothetical protein